MVSAHTVSARCESKTVTAPEAAYKVACLDDERGKEANSWLYPVRYSERRAAGLM